MLKLTNQGHHMKKLNSKGFSYQVILLTIIVVGLLIGGGVYYFQHYKKVASPATTSSSQQTNQQAQAQTQPQTSQAKYLEIKEWGIKFKLTDNIQDAYYDAVKATSMDAFSLRTHSLDFEEDCRTGSQSIVAIFRVGKDAKDEAVEGNKTYAETMASQGVTIGDYFYFTQGAQYGCAKTQKGNDILGKVRGEFSKAGATIEQQ
jgi:hypothetical protein